MTTDVAPYARMLAGLEAIRDTSTDKASRQLADSMLAALAEIPRLRPCHVTGLHTPEHHLKHPRPCDIQAREIAESFFGDLSKLPRQLHLQCGWCGTRPIGPADTYTQRKDEQEAWANGH